MIGPRSQNSEKEGHSFLLLHQIELAEVDESKLATHFTSAAHLHGLPHIFLSSILGNRPVSCKCLLNTLSCHQ